MIQLRNFIISRANYWFPILFENKECQNSILNAAREDFGTQNISWSQYFTSLVGLLNYTERYLYENSNVEIPVKDWDFVMTEKDTESIKHWLQASERIGANSSDNNKVCGAIGGAGIGSFFGLGGAILGGIIGGLFGDNYTQRKKQEDNQLYRECIYEIVIAYFTMIYAHNLCFCSDYIPGQNVPSLRNQYSIPDPSPWECQQRKRNETTTKIQ